MENKLSPIKRHDFVKLILGTLVALIIVFTLTGGYGVLFLVPIIILIASFYVVVLISRKIISENNVVGRSLFVVFFGVLLSAILIALLWHPGAI